MVCRYGGIRPALNEQTLQQANKHLSNRYRLYLIAFRNNIGAIKTVLTFFISHNTSKNSYHT